MPGQRDKWGRAKRGGPFYARHWRDTCQRLAGGKVRRLHTRLVNARGRAPPPGPSNSAAQRANGGARSPAVTPARPAGRMPVLSTPAQQACLLLWAWRFAPGLPLSFGTGASRSRCSTSAAVALAVAFAIAMQAPAGPRHQHQAAFGHLQTLGTSSHTHLHCSGCCITITMRVD